MGNQQLLLIAIGIVIVGVALAVGITMFNNESAASEVDGMYQDLQFLANAARQFRQKPAFVGGGDGSFTGITSDRGLQNLVDTRGSSDPKTWTTKYGVYWLAIDGDDDQVVFSGKSLLLNVGGSINDGFKSIDAWVYRDSTRFEEAN